MTYPKPIFTSLMAPTSFKKKTLQNLRSQLENTLQEIEEDARMEISGMRKPSATFPDPTDRANMESGRNLNLRIRDRQRKLSMKVQEAIQRIDDNTFGNCETCGELIELPRLMARPVTTLCIRCKEQQEILEKKP